jgi:hypothetical protein
VRVRVRVRVRARVCARARECVRAYVYVCVCNVKEFYASKNIISQTVETCFTFINCIIFYNCGIRETATPSAI